MISLKKSVQTLYFVSLPIYGNIVNDLISSLTANIEEKI